MNRCRWCNEKNPTYVTYHDCEWGILKLDDSYLFEMLLLESFQAGLSWECILNKRENFKESFDHFNWNIIAKYNQKKIDELMKNQGIIRNKRKIESTINNAKIFQEILEEFGSFETYLRSFWNGKIIKENDKTTNELSDKISNDLQKRGMKFVGSTIIYSYLQAIGIISSHEDTCDWRLK
ncbi:MAG: DNA-3-methyladenine glycosylase I [Bacilli bacterium]|nr:DNA-3-methyladenine glycosylase I [Bacilli bacterium]